MTEPLEPLDPETAREEAFTAAPFHWRGMPLHALAVSRESDWLIHCRRCKYDPPSESFTMAHAVRLLWFCAHEPATWLAHWTAGGAVATILLEEKIRQWADEHIPPGEQVAALRLASDIYDRAYISRAAVLDDGAEDPLGNEPGPSDVRSIAASSHGPAPASSPSINSATSSRRSAAGPMSTATSSRKGRSRSGPKKRPVKRRPSGKG